MIWSFCLLSAVSLTLFGVEESQVSLKNLAEQASKAYHSGEEASVREEREYFFHRAFTHYLELSRHVRSPELEYNIGNCYFHFAEYGRAILHYYRALLLSPRFVQAKNNEKRARVLSQVYLPPLYRRIFLPLFLPFSEREAALLLWIILSMFFSFASLSLWMPSFQKIKIMGKLFFFSLLSLFLYFVVVFRVQGEVAVLIQPTLFYKEPSTQYVSLLKEPLPMGTLVFPKKQGVEKGDWIYASFLGGEGFFQRDVAEFV